MLLGKMINMYTPNLLIDYNVVVRAKQRYRIYAFPLIRWEINEIMVWLNHTQLNYTTVLVWKCSCVDMYRANFYQGNVHVIISKNIDVMQYNCPMVGRENQSN